MFENSELQRLFSQKPTTKNISGIKQLQTFIQNYPDDSLKPNLYKLLADHQYYRPVNGDGNCFYRAIMFLYLRQADLGHYEALFPPANLLKCKNLPFQVSRHITSQDLLEYLWQTQLQPLANSSPENREKKLQEMMNKSQAIDSILVAYFRVLNYDYLVKNRREIQPYTDGGIQNDLNRVLFYGKESEGVQIYSLSKILDITIEIIMVHQQNLTLIDYNHQARGKKFQLFYRPGHYDIICEQRQYERQTKSTIEKPSFTQFFKQNKNEKSTSSNLANHYSQSRNNSPLASQIISVSKPSEIKLISHTSHTSRTDNNLKAPTTMKQFKQNLRDGFKGQGSRLNRKSQQQHFEMLSPKRESERHLLEDGQKSKVVQIKSAKLQKKDQALKQKMLWQALLCTVALIALVAGIYAL